MACTTILVGKNATFDGSTMVARNEDSPSGQFCEKKFIVVHPNEQPVKYKSVLSHVEIDLPTNPMRYTCMPNAVDNEGIWGACGVNELNISMSATETLTSNERVLGADPLVEYVPAVGKEGDADYIPEKVGGIGEEDMVTLVLPYIKSAREGVLRLGELLEKYGTYEMNGIAFQDVNEIWWLETIGGHHWIARRVPDDCYVIMPNQLGLDFFDLEDAFGGQKEYLCSSDLKEFINILGNRLNEKNNIVVAVSEGIKDQNGNYISEDEGNVDAFGHKMLSGTAAYLAKKIKSELGVKTRAVEINTLQRAAAHLQSKTDIDEAFNIGFLGVKAGIEGETGVMMYFDRVNDAPYLSIVRKCDINLVANIEKEIPRGWISEDGFGVNEKFIEYAKPLITGELSNIVCEGIQSHIISLK